MMQVVYPSDMRRSHHLRKHHGEAGCPERHVTRAHVEWPGGSVCQAAPHFADLSADTLPKVSEDPTPQRDDDDVEGTVEATQAALADARQRLASVPAEVVVVNHVMGMYELAAIHLSATPPSLADAALAIDAVGCVVEGLGVRLGADLATLQEALSNIRLAFVQIKGATDSAGSTG